MKVLIVEDDETLLGLIKVLLELENFKTIILKKPSLEAVISTIQSHEPEYVLIDVHMSEANGLDILKRIRRSNFSLQPKVLMWSGMPMKNECINAGADAFLLKPFDPDDLIGWLRSK